MEATIIDDVDPSSTLARDEIFGPVVAVMPFETEDEALALANASQYGLAATVLSNDINVAVRMACNIEAETVAVNGYGEGDITTPFGGCKTSGFGGCDKGFEAFDQYTHIKTIRVTLS